MKIAFIVHRTNYFKFYGPIILAAYKRGWQIECWLCQEPGGKSYLMPTAQNSPMPLQRLMKQKILNIIEIRQEIKKTQADILVSLHPKCNYLNADDSSPYFITLQHGIDTFVEADVTELSSSDLVCLYSQFWADWGANYYADANGVSLSEAKELLLRKVRFIGFPQMDALGVIDREEVSDRFGIDLTRPVILFLPISLSNKGGAWPRFFESTTRVKQIRRMLEAGKSEGWEFVTSHWLWALMGWNDAKLTSAVAEFCKTNNAQLVAKVRDKDKARPWLIETAVRTVYDESYYPPTILELLSIADVCIHFYSFAALEAADAGAFGVTIHRPSPQANYSEEPPAYHRLWRGKETGSAFNYPGVNAWMTIPDAVRSLPGTKLSTLQIDCSSRSSFIEKFLGKSRHTASESLLEFAESRL